jgi:hypothetical protein
MAVNYMDRLAALRGDRQHAAGAHGSLRSAPVLHADERAKKSAKRKKKLSRKQRAALAKGRRVMAAMRRTKKKGKSMPKRKKSRGAKPVRTSRGRAAVTRHKRSLASRRAAATRRRAKPVRVTRGRKAVARRRAERRIERMTPKQRKAHYLALLGTGRKKKRKKRAAPKRNAMAKKKRKKSKSGGRKSPKRVAAGKKAARTRKRHRAERAAARRGGGRKRRRGGHKRRSHKRSHARRAAPKRRRRRGGRARRRNKGLVRRNNRTGIFVGKGGRARGRKRRGGYHKAGRILREGYSMENPLSMSELGIGLVTGLVGYIAADLTDRYLAANRPPLGGTLYAEATPIYSDYLRLGLGLGMAIVPLAGAHFLDGNRHSHIRAALQFFGFGAGLRTLGHLFNDVVAGQLKNNSMVGAQVQRLYPHEIVSQAQLAGAQAAIAKTGAAGLPEHIAQEVAGLGAIPQGLAACCNTSSRMLNPALSVLQPIGRSAEGGGAAANYAPPPVSLPPPIERVVQQPYTPIDMGGGGGGGGGGGRTPGGNGGGMRAPTPAQPALPQQPPATVARNIIVQQPAAQSMVSAYAPALPPPVAGVNGLPDSPFGWGEDRPG